VPTSNEFTPAQVAKLLGVSIGGDRPTGKMPSASAGGDPNGLAKAVGQRMVFESREAFRTQSWDGKDWLKRYPNQSDPKVNVAGIVSDLGQGISPPKNRFQDSPVLEHTGRLVGSITYRVKGPSEVEVGSNVKYASRMQTGGKSVQPITETVRSNLADFLRGLRGKKKRKRGERRQKTRKDLIAEKLGFLFAIDVLETDIVPRTFLAVNDRIEKALAKSIESYFDKHGGGR
jgi:phage gpG-like protein